MTKLDKETTPRLFDHCVTVYEAMLERAEKVQLDGQTEGMVYQGHLTTLIKSDLNLSTPYYTFVTRALKEMGCITMLRRGGSSSQSQWQLLTDPTEARFIEYHAKQNPKDRILTEVDGKIFAQRITDLNNRLSSQDDRISALERAMGLR